MSFDPNEHRAASLENWEAAASGWVRRQEQLRELGRPVSEWLIDALAPQPGQRVLELAAGLGETGMLAAELVAPFGSVLISDQSQAMIDGARERASQLGLGNVDFQVLNAEWLDLPLASFDGVLCRWGYMLMADPATALSESRRVLTPGGRIALAVWDSLDANPWAQLPGIELRERGLTPPPSGEPGPFALADRDRLRELLEGAGFTEIRIESVELNRTHDDFEDLWEMTLDLSRVFHDAVLARPEGEIEEIRESLHGRFEPFEKPGGGLEIPGRTLVAAAVG
jgi:SAM-dependent methyltransferase